MSIKSQMHKNRKSPLENSHCYLTFMKAQNLYIIIYPTQHLLSIDIEFKLQNLGTISEKNMIV